MPDSSDHVQPDRFLRSPWPLLPATVLWLISATAASAETQYLQGPARDALLKHLEAQSERYDPEAKLIRIARVPRSDYTRRQGQAAHPTRASIGYAFDLLEANDPEHRRRACDVIRKVLSLQDTNRSSLTYGLWPWYAEEPLDKMFAPDYNWAAFIGRVLLGITIFHEHQLPADLRKDVREAIYRACVCIRRRPLHMGYTNIAAMSSYVTLVAGERLGDPKLLKYGRWLFDKWYDYTMLQGSFTEFNSPTYTNVAIGVVSRMLAHMQDPKRRAKAETLNRMLWLHKARRFHAPTLQWAGPHSRSYSNLPGSGFEGLIKRAPGGALAYAPPERKALDISNNRGPYRPPDDLARYLRPLAEPREEIEVFLKAGHKIPNGMGNVGRIVSQRPIVGTTYLHPRFSLGSVNFMDFWEQHRNLIAYWGTPEAPTYMTMRCMNRGHGFCSAYLASVQLRGDVLAGVVFATDWGDRYIDMDPLPNKTFKTSSLRVEFELGGHLDQARIPDSVDLDKPFVIEDRGVRITLQYLAGTFAGHRPTAEIKRAPGQAILVLHLHKGDTKAFRLPDLTEAACLLGVQASEAKPNSAPWKKPKVSQMDDTYTVTWDGLRLQIPRRPMRLVELQRQICATVNSAEPQARATSLLQNDCHNIKPDK
jgi:hypothetical protein